MFQTKLPNIRQLRFFVSGFVLYHRLVRIDMHAGCTFSAANSIIRIAIGKMKSGRKVKPYQTDISTQTAGGERRRQV